MVFTSDTNLTLGDTFEVEVARFQSKDQGRTAQGQVRTQGVPLEMPVRSTYCLASNMNNDVPRLRTMTFFADFDIQRLADLRLTLPNSTSMGAYVNSGANRKMVPGFVAAAITGSLNVMIDNAATMLMRRNTKRKRMGAVAAPKPSSNEEQKMETEPTQSGLSDDLS
mmetsp:Transcript_20657/g.31364  ORF Transcript_20657/g.31364 Transcript_20657/m.31364 type:complete len:167 (+) Transcript_20657:1821-2321(+)